MPETTEKFKCPDCEATFAKASALGPHRNKAHGYRLSDGKNDPTRAQGNPPSDKRKRPKKRDRSTFAQVMHAGKFPCPHCDFVAQWKGGLTKHTNHKHPQTTKKEKTELAQTHQNAPAPLHLSNGHLQAEDDRSHRLEAAATFATGRITELLTGVAVQYDLPPRSLAALVLRTLAQTAQIR